MPQSVSTRTTRSEPLLLPLERETECQEPIAFNEGSSAPIFFSSPHSGRFYPPSFLEQTRLSIYNLQRMEDRFVDDLLSDVPQLGMSFLKALFPRSFCDVNRDWRELDGRMFTPALDEKELVRSQRVMAGYGVIPRCTAPGHAIYRQTLPAEIIEQRLQNYWAPFHKKLHQTLETLRHKSGYAILFDVHSMPALQHDQPCDIVLGNCHKRSCSPLLMNYVQHYFEKLGYKVQKNIPYAGGFITEYYGNPKAHIHVLQIEISRSLYLNQTTLMPNQHYNQFKKELSLFAKHSLQWLSDRALINHF